MTSLKIGIITQARVGSTRLPAKTLLKLGDECVLGMHIQRLKQTGFEVYVATTFESRSSELLAIANAYGAKTWQGSTDDVLSRYYTCAKFYELDVVVRVTSDCPLISPELIQEGMEQYLKLANSENTYFSNTQVRKYPRGMDFEIFSFSLLEKAHLNSLELRYREHVTPYLYQSNTNPVIDFTDRNFDRSRGDWRITLDTDLDFQLISTLVDKYQADRLSYGQLLDVLDTNTALMSINKDIEQKKV